MRLMTGLSLTFSEFCVCAKSRSYDGDVGKYQVRMCFTKSEETLENGKIGFFFCLKFMRGVQQGNGSYANNLFSRTKQPVSIIVKA